MRHHLELAVGQALPTLGALETAGLPAKDIEHVHAINLPPILGQQTSKLDTVWTL
jgi:hypothetical protein